MQSEMLETDQSRIIPPIHLMTRLLQYGQSKGILTPTDSRQGMPNRLDISWHLCISFCRGERGTRHALLRHWPLHYG